MRLQVGVIGPGGEVDGQEMLIAGRVGRLLAERSVVVMTGGLDGVMAAAAEGAAGAGGVVVGVLPGVSHSGGSSDLTVALPTGLGQLRNGLLVGSCHAVISVGGSWGTLSEIAIAMRTGVPVVSIGGWQVSDASGTEQYLVRAADAEQAVDLALDQAARRISP